jgi:hypothetical protein
MRMVEQVHWYAGTPRQPPISGFCAVRHLGRGLAAPAPSGPGGFGSGDPKLKFDALVHVLLARAVVIVTARLLR